MNDEMTRREMLAATSAGLVAATLASSAMGDRLMASKPWFRVSLAEWSLNKPLFAGEIDNLDFAAEAAGMGFGGVEFVNSFFKDKASDEAYLAELNLRASNAGVEQLLIMCDDEGRLGDPDDGERGRAVENHHRWVEAAAVLGCHSIRVNAASAGSYEEQQRLAADGLRRLCEFGHGHGINVIVENHGGLSSNGAWLAGVMRLVDHPRCGTLPDFGNFCLDWERRDEPDAWYDRYQGVAELMPFARAVSAKSHAFDEAGDETSTDYRRMLVIIKDSGYRGWIGVEYEGDAVSPREGSKLTKALLERIRDEQP